MSVALYPGSFDPIHRGHVGIIQAVACFSDEVVVAVVSNPHKTTGMFQTTERVALVATAIANMPTVRAVHFHGLTVDLARREGATVLVRAAHKEQANELDMAAMNLRLSGIDTIFVPAEPGTRTISSTRVRSLVAAGRLSVAQDLVPECVADALAGRATS